MKISKWIVIILLLIFGGFSIMVLSIGTLRSQIMEKAGLAVAQTPIRWNNVKDAAVGDNQTDGILASAPYLFDGVNYDPARGTVTSGMWVNIMASTNLPIYAATNIPVTAAGNFPVYTTLSTTISHNQVVVSTGAGGNLIIAANVQRKSVMVRNQGVTDMYVGNTGVTTGTGFAVKAGEALTLDRTTAAIYGITAAANTIVGYLEE